MGSMGKIKTNLDVDYIFEHLALNQCFGIWNYKVNSRNYGETIIRRKKTRNMGIKKKPL